MSGNFITSDWFRWINYILVGLILILHISASSEVEYYMGTNFPAVIIGVFVACLITTKASDKDKGKWSTQYTIIYCCLSSIFCVMSFLYLNDMLLLSQTSKDDYGFLIYFIPTAIFIFNACNIDNLFGELIEGFVQKE